MEFKTMQPAISTCMLGAIAGDIIGSVYEFSCQKSTDFPLFSRHSRLTDDSILSLAVAESILTHRGYAECIRKFALRYPDMSYGGNFRQWMHSNSPQPYNSFGNGSAMRVSAVGWAFSSLEKVLEEAEASAAVTHDHPEGIRGAQAVALAIFLARSGASREEIRNQVTSRFGYDLSQTVDEIRPTYSFDETCQNTVPQALIAFLEGRDFEDSIRKAVSLGGDADTLAAITGSVAEPFFGGVPQGIAEQVKQRVPSDLLDILDRFKERYHQTAHTPGMV